MTNTDHTKPAAAHTPEPWQYGCTPHACNGLAHKVFVDGEEVASCGKEANARRIVAAVNACKGISNDALEQGVVAELRRALELFLEFNDQWLIATDTQTDLEHDRVMQIAHTAIAKAGSSSPPNPRNPIVIEVRGGIVQDVLNVPPGYDYEVKDYDTIETNGGAA